MSKRKLNLNEIPQVTSWSGAWKVDVGWDFLEQHIWNALVPVGTEVVLTDDDGRLEHTKTRSVAWRLGHGAPVVCVEGRLGGYSLWRVQPLVPLLCPRCDDSGDT